MSKHTRGPWVAQSDDGGVQIVAPHGNETTGGSIIAAVTYAPPGQRDPERLANARLIAAAPETAAERDRLREVMETAIKLLDGSQPRDIPGCIMMLRAALDFARARGEE